jgi:ketosteroid isomerase-like protein
VEHGRGSASGADVTARSYQVVTFRDGKVLRYEEFYEERAALAALER